MELKIVDNADVSGEELERFEQHDFGKEMAEGLKDGSTLVSDEPWEETAKAIKAKKSRKVSKMASFRLPVWVIEGLKRNAAKGGVKYSEYAVEVLSKAAR